MQRMRHCHTLRRRVRLWRLSTHLLYSRSQLPILRRCIGSIPGQHEGLPAHPVFGSPELAGESTAMRVTLVVPPELACVDEERVEYLGLGYIAACTRQAGHHVDILDCRSQALGYRDAAAKIRSLDPG